MFGKIKTKLVEKTPTKTMEIEGMKCMHCEAKVKKCLEEMPEISEAVVNHKKNSAVVKLSAEVSDETLTAAVEALGFHVVSVK